MDALISLVYTIIDSVCVCLFLDAFASHRWRDHRFLVGVIVQTILMYASIEFSVIVLNRNQIVKIFLILLSCFIVARTLYENISGKFLLFLIVVEYLLTYSLSFAVGMLATSVCGMDAQTFQADKTLSLIYGISYYSAELFIIALFRKIMLQRIDMVLNKQQLSAPGGKTPEKESVLKQLEQFQQKKSHHKTTSTPPNREESL